MFPLSHHREPCNRLPDLLPWAALVAPGVVLQKDGLLQKTSAVRGRDLASCSPQEVGYAALQLNKALMRLGTGWSLFWESQRCIYTDYPSIEWRHSAAWVADKERCEMFRSGTHYESSYFMTLVKALPSRHDGAAERFFYTNEGGTASVDKEGEPLERVEEAISAYREEVGSIVSLLKANFSKARELTDDETLTYLHSTISTHRHKVKAPAVPQYLDALLPDVAFTAGDFPMLGDSFVLTSTVVGLPDATYPALLEALNQLHVEYRWVTRFIAMDRTDARKVLRKYVKSWKQKIKGVAATFEEMFSGGASSSNVDEEASELHDDAVHAQGRLAGGGIGFGYLTTTVTVMDTNLEAAQAKQKLVREALEANDIVVIDEAANNKAAWLGSLPGNVYANVRRPIVSTKNLVHMLPMQAPWQGERFNSHLKAVTARRDTKGGVGNALLQCSTTGASPFFLNLNLGELGHSLVIGPTRSGKSTLLSSLALQWLRYPGARVVFFDKDLSARATTMAVGGKCYVPGSGAKNTGFQPLLHLDTEKQASWASEFVLLLFRAQGLEETPALKSHIRESIDDMAMRPPTERTLTRLSKAMSPFAAEYATALSPYCEGGNFAHVFDSNSEQLGQHDWTLFEMGPLMEMGKQVLEPALFYMLHRLETQFDGSPFLLVLDEAHFYIRDEAFCEQLRVWLKTLAKKHVFVVIATQEVADAVANPEFLSTVTSACRTRIFLADPTATSPTMAKYYRLLSLSEREIQILTEMTRQREYYLHTPENGCRFNLSLGPAQLAFAAMANTDDQKILDAIEGSQDPEQYAEAMLEARGVTWAVEALRTLREERRAA